MPRDASEDFYSNFLAALQKDYRDERIKDGAFGEYMQVHIENDGPVTITLDSRDR